ncbi:MAG: hypothetical protein LBT40_15980, partial [Deltaproteobacteria bacterium]|nr:hypothetical protein [Deltaproteobacteria bacterium]
MSRGPETGPGGNVLTEGGGTASGSTVPRPAMVEAPKRAGRRGPEEGRKAGPRRGPEGGAPKRAGRRGPEEGR